MTSLRNSKSFVGLSDGRCHYSIEGPSDGKPLLLIHGATVPAWEFDRLVPYLTANGFRCLRPDLFGHGYSDRPRADHDYALFVRQLEELLAAVELRRPVHLFGHSLGAAVAARLVQSEPERFGAVIMGAPMLDFLANVRGSSLLRVPLLGELVTHTYIVPMLKRRRARRYRDIEDGRFVGKFMDQVAYPGFGRSMLSLMTSGALGDQSDVYAALGRLRHPVYLLRGSDDNIVTASQFDAIGRLLPKARRSTLDGTAHAMILTHPERVATEVIGFLGSRDLSAAAEVGSAGSQGKSHPVTTSP